MVFFIYLLISLPFFTGWGWVWVYRPFCKMANKHAMALCRCARVNLVELMELKFIVHELHIAFTIYIVSAVSRRAIQF